MSWYVVSGHKGVQLRSGSALTSNKIEELAHMTRVRVESMKTVTSGNREIERCEIVLPVKGWVSKRLLRLEDSDPGTPAAVDEPWPAGSKVRFVGLEGAAALNGASGRVAATPGDARPDARYLVEADGRLLRCRRVRLEFLEYAPDDDVYAYEAEAEALGEAEALFGKMRRWYAGTSTASTGPFPPSASALVAWKHYGGARRAYVIELEKAESAIQVRRDADAEDERKRATDEARRNEQLKVDGEAVPVGTVGDGDGAPTARSAHPKGTLVLIKGLTAKPALNGRSGVVAEDYDVASGRYKLALADKTFNVRWENIELHPTQRARDKMPKGDEVVFVTEEEAREGMYTVKIDPQFYYDKAIDRVLAAENEFEVLDLPVAATKDMSSVKRQYRKISLAVHPDKNRHPQANAAFRKTYGAFETLSDAKEQHRLLVKLGLAKETAPFAWCDEDDAAFGDEEEDDDEQFQWWWEASVSEVEKAAEEAEGARMDSWASSWISDGLGGDVSDVRWVGLPKAKKLHETDGAIWIDVREGRGRAEKGTIPGAWSVPMGAVFDYGIVTALGQDLIHEILSVRRHQPIVVFSAVATPFSRCRSFCRFILRAGHVTLKAKRFRRLRGGIFGWKHKGGAVAMSIMGSGQARSEATDRFASKDKWQAEDGGDAD